MLCTRCETLVTNLVHREVATWRRLRQEHWYAFKHGDHASVAASAATGCELCRLFNRVRRQRIESFDGLAPKWQEQNASVEVNQASVDSMFHLLTGAPKKSWIPFELFKPVLSEPGSDDKVGAGQLWPLEVPHGHFSDVTIKVARQWITDCQFGHVSCKRSGHSILPTRVIDVGHSDDVAVPRICINHRRELVGRYIALSHCWGTGDRLTTTKDNLGAFQQSIPYEKLPKTFQDAITLTRLLGVQYLWLDALCIVSDDEEDWQRESAVMCDVYENAALIISATAAADSNAGLWAFRENASCTAIVDHIRVGIRAQLNSLPIALQQSRIETRAWCLQECILASAILHVGPQQWYWECKAGHASESFPDQLVASHGELADSTMSKHRFIPSNIPRTELLQTWYDLVEQYSSRNLTRPSDRLPAIAGLADRIGRELKNSSEYFYGLWTDDLAVGLLWHRPLTRHAESSPSRDHHQPDTAFVQPAERLQHRITSSWSWAAVYGAVAYSWTSVYNTAVASQQLDISVLSLEPEGPSIRLTGLLRRGTCRQRLTTSTEQLHNSTGGEGNAVFRPSGSRIAEPGVMCIMDDVNEIMSKSCYCLRISSWRKEAAGQSRRKQHDVIRVFYLILERLQSPADIVELSSSSTQTDLLGRFKRIGMGYDELRKANGVFSNAERHLIELW